MKIFIRAAGFVLAVLMLVLIFGVEANQNAWNQVNDESEAGDGVNLAPPYNLFEGVNPAAKVYSYAYGYPPPHSSTTSTLENTTVTTLHSTSVSTGK